MPKTNHHLKWRFLFLKKPVKSAYFYSFVLPNLIGRLIATMVVISMYANSAFAATASDEMCKLIEQLQGVFQTLRIFAFVGAGFILAKYGWEAITSGKIGGKSNIADGIKEIGVPMIVGFALLFSIGIILGFFMNGENFGCPALTTGW